MRRPRGRRRAGGRGPGQGGRGPPEGGTVRENNDNITNLFRLGPRGVTASGLLYLLIAVQIAAHYKVLVCLFSFTL